MGGVDGAGGDYVHVFCEQSETPVFSVQFGDTQLVNAGLVTREAPSPKP